MKAINLLTALVALNLTYLTPALLADIKSDITSSFNNQPSSEHQVRYISAETVVKEQPDSASESLVKLKTNQRIFVIGKAGPWAEVQPVSGPAITGFIPLSSLSDSSIKDAPSAAENNVVDIDLSDVTLKTPQEIALAQKQRVEQEKQQKVEAEEAYRRYLKEKSRQRAELEAQQRREEAREQRESERKRQEMLAESETRDAQLARQWENLTRMPSNITQLDSPYQIERERRRALRMKEYQSRQKQHAAQAQSQTAPSRNNHSFYTNNRSKIDSNSINSHESSDQSYSSSKPSSPQTNKHDELSIDKTTVQQNPNVLQKVYEPSPQIVTSENLSTFSNRDNAIAYARLKANNKISDQCYEKGARYDTTKFSEIEKGNSSERTTFANPDCKQMKSGSWKCSAEVRGHCYRMQ